MKAIYLSSNWWIRDIVFCPLSECEKNMYNLFFIIFSDKTSLTPIIRWHVDKSSEIIAPASSYSFSLKILNLEGYTNTTMEGLIFFSLWTSLGVKATLRSHVSPSSLLIPILPKFYYVAIIIFSIFYIFFKKKV